MAQVRHPAFPDTRKEVDNPGEWVKQGWLLVEDDGPAQPKRRAPRRARGSSQTTSKGEQEHA